MRVVAGVAKGHRLRAPRGIEARYTSSFVRGALFNILAPELLGSRFLDLFAGVGSVGIEAASRGAAEVVMVERDARRVRYLARNVREAGLSQVCRVLRQDAFGAVAMLGRAKSQFDLVFLDPPYRGQAAAAAVAQIAAAALLAPRGTLIAEHSRRESLPSEVPPLALVRREVYGDTALSFYRLQPEEETGLVKAICPGTFDPVTNGHLDVIERAARIFDQVRVVVFRNPEKAPLFDVSERVRMLEESLGHLPNVQIDVSDGLLVAYARSAGAQVIVKGLRAVSDFEYEFQMAHMNKKLDQGIETFFLAAATEHAYLSSSLVKMLASLGACTRDLVPPGVEASLRRKFAGAKPPAPPAP